MKILIAENDPAVQRMLAGHLTADGHDILLAATCEETLARYAAQQPELVLLRTDLPEGGGYRCTRAIAVLANSDLAPVMLMASAQAPLVLERFVECGAADFIDAVVDPMPLRARVAGYRRTREMQLEMLRAQSRLRHEVKLARHMFNSVIRRSPLDAGNLRHWMVSAGHFSGDLLVYERAPEGDLHVLLCDFTGHGLSAAVGALPTSDIFFAMTRKGCTLAEIAAEINRKLNLLMPTGHFCAAILARFSPAHDEMEIWNGGQPPVLLLDARGRSLADAVSAHFPLGVMPPGRFDPRTRSFPLHGIRHVVLCSDGLLEARNPHGEMFGPEGLRRALLTARDNGVHLLHTIKSQLVGFLDGLEPHDDVSLLTVDLAAASVD